MKDDPTIKSVAKKGRLLLITLSDGTEYELLPHLVKQHNLSKGSAIDKTLLIKLQNESNLFRANRYIEYLLARASYSYGTLRQKMLEKGYHPEIVKKVLANFTRLGLIDDRQFTQNYVRNLLSRKPAGKSFIIAQLRKKHISASMAQSIVDEIFGDIDETELALKLLRQRWRHFSKFELETARRKAYNYLSRRSISYRAAKSAFEKIIKEVEEN